MQKMKKMLVTGLAAAMALTVPFCTIVKAQELEDPEDISELCEEYITHGCGIVLSEDTVEGYSLEWESWHFFDTLTAVDGENLHVTYEYDEIGQRTGRTENGKRNNNKLYI